MSVNELSVALSRATFIGDGSSALIYRFDAETMKFNNAYLAKWNLYEEDGKIYLKTEPPIKGEDFLIEIVSNKYPLSLHLYTKYTGRHFVTLTETD